MTIELHKAEIAANSRRPWQELSQRERRWLAAKILRSRVPPGDARIVRMLETANPNANYFNIVE